MVTHSKQKKSKPINDPSTTQNTILLGVKITTSNREPQWVIDKALRELELTFGDAVKFAFSEIHPK